MKVSTDSREEESPWAILMLEESVLLYYQVRGSSVSVNEQFVNVDIFFTLNVGYIQ